MADYLPPVVAKLTGDDSNLSTVLTRAKEKVRRFAADVGRIKATVNVDAKLRDGALAEIRRRVNEGPAAKLKVELQLATAQREQLRQGLEQRPIQVTIKPVMDQMALRRVQIALGELGKRIDVSVRPQVEDASARRTLTRLDRLSRDRTVTIRTRVIGDSSPGGGGGGGGGGDAVGMLSTLISLAPALVPIAASAASVAASVGAATVAVSAFGAAVIPQIKALGDAADAQKTYNDAVTKYGAGSTQAAAAQAAFAKTMASMPPATRQAAGGFLVLKDRFKSWSDGLSKFTMAPVTKSFAVVEAMLPKLTPMVKGASQQFDRLMTVAAGAMTTPGFDALAKRFSDFANGALKHATDDVIHFSRVLSEGQASGPIAKFMAYAKTNGPAVRETLANLAKAVGNIVQGASQAGPGMLSLVNALAKLVNALPPSFIATAMQAYTAFKLIKLAGVGMGAASGGVQALIARITALRAASLGAGGGLAALRAAFMSLGTAGKATVVVAGIAALAVVLTKISDIGKKAPPDVDKMTASIAQLGRTGQVSGEALRAYGADLATLGDSLRTLARPSNEEGVQQFLTKLIGMDSTPVKKAKDDIHALDASLASLVQSGHADVAAASFQTVAAAMAKQGMTSKELRAETSEYTSALADQAFEQKLAADSMGLFGTQAQAVQAKLDAQKASTDGLRQSIQALNDTNRAGLDGEIGFEAAIDAATKAAKENGRALHMKNDQLQLGTEKARNEAQALSDLAAKTDANASAARDNGASWSAVNKIYDRGRAKLIAAAEAMGLNTKDAKKLADQILKTPDKTAKLRGNLEDLQAKLASAKRQLASVPDSRKAKIQASIDQLKAQIAAAKAAISSVHGKTVNIYSKYINVGKQPGTGTVLANADGSVIHGGVRRMADGGMGRPAMMARGGTNVLWAEGGNESYIPHDQRPRSRSIAEQTVAIMGGNVTWGNTTTKSATALGGHVAGGLIAGLTAGQGAVAAAAASLGKTTIAAFSNELGIASPSKKFRALGAYVMHGLVQGLTGTTAQVKAATKRIASNLYVDFGSHQKGLQRYVARESKELQSLAGKRDAVAAKLKAAKAKLADLKKAWIDEAKSIASGIMQGFTIVTTAPQEGFALTAQDVVNKMQTQMQAAVQFATNLDALKKKGLSSALIEQLATAGVDQGGDTVTALMGASKGQLNQLNSMQSTTQSAANKTGKVVADAMYGAGIKSAQGLVKGLQSQEKAIERQMLKIAKAMQAAIKKALGIKSPSRVFAELGKYVPQGLAMGIQDATHHATKAVSRLAGSVAGAGAFGAPGLALTGGGASASAVHYHFTFNIAGSVATVDKLSKDVEAAFLRRGARNPLTYAPYKR